MRCLEGKVAVVTGGGHGIGRSCAVTLARQGAQVVVCDVGCSARGEGSDERVVLDTAAVIASEGGEVEALHADVTQGGVAQQLVSLARERFGGLDVVVSCAGIQRERTVLNATADDLHAVWSVQVGAAFELLAAASRDMVDRSARGSIVMCTAPVAFFGAARQVPLGTCAAAVAGLVRSAAAELRKHRIRVNAIAPTARTRQTEHQPMFQGLGPTEMGPEHIAALVAFLGSDLAEEVTGEVLGAAGGRIYAVRPTETIGAFSEGRTFMPEDIRDAWQQITRT